MNILQFLDISLAAAEVALNEADNLLQESGCRGREHRAPPSACIWKNTNPTFLQSTLHVIGRASDIGMFSFNLKKLG